MKFKLPGGGMGVKARGEMRRKRQAERRKLLKGTGISLADLTKKDWALDQPIPTDSVGLQNARIERRIKKRKQGKK